MKWILIGPNEVIEHKTKRKTVENTTSIVTQLIMQSFKTKRQVEYHATDDSNRGMSQTNETPLSIGLGLYVHQKTICNELIETLYNMNLSVNYQKVLNIKTNIETSVKEKAAKQGGIYIPSVISPNKPVYIATDNSNLKVDTPDGKNQLHGTAIAVCQSRDNDFTTPSLIIECQQIEEKETKQTHYKTIFCPEPVPQNEVYQSYQILKHDLKLSSLKDTAYFIIKSLNIESENDVPTWTAYNSLISKEKAISTYCSLPLIHGSPTDWSNLYSSLMVANNIRLANSKQRKTIVAFDLQLYSKCIQLQAREEINSTFVFRMGELHVVFAFLKCIGKYIDNSRLDDIFIEAKIYGPSTMEKMKGGNHMKRSFEAYLTLYIALYQLYLETIIKTNSAIESTLRDGTKFLAMNMYDCRTRSSFNRFISCTGCCCRIEFLQV